jgi:hypothetical protein
VCDLIIYNEGEISYRYPKSILGEKIFLTYFLSQIKYVE